MTHKPPLIPPEQSVTVLVGSDVCPTRNDEALFKNGSPSRLLNDYSDLWAGADCTVFNLECPLTDAAGRIRKIGPHLKASPACAAFFKHAPTRVVCLANNHIRDYGDQGVLDTLQVCHSAGLSTVGAGPNLEEARTPLCLTVKGLRLGIVAMAEREFNIAGPKEAGANPIDPRNFTRVRELRNQTDFLLVLLHAGTEMFQYPRPGLVDLCRFLVEQGADAVLVQHTHCLGCHEIHRGAPIVYGQGNGIFALETTPLHQMDPIWFEGVLVELRVGSARRCQIGFHPYEQSRGFAGIRRLAGAAGETLLRGLQERSRVLQNPAALRGKWAEYCLTRRRDAIAWNLGISGFLASADYRLGVSRLIDALTDRDLRWQMIACESHRELLADCLRGED